MSIDTDYQVLRDVLAEHKPTGWAIEFGVYSGYSLAIIAEQMPVIGLDWFRGLPEDWREGFPKGTFEIADTDEAVLAVATTGIVGPNRMIVPGLFEDTLPVLRERGLPPLGLVHIDCDLYSSTVTALEGIWEYLDVGTIVVFDEYHGYPGYQQHEAKAWAEFCTKYGVLYTMLATGEQERAFRVTKVGPLRV